MVGRLFPVYIYFNVVEGSPSMVIVLLPIALLRILAFFSTGCLVLDCIRFITMVPSPASP